MGAFLSQGETYERTLREADDELIVTLRPLMAGDRADLQDQLRILVTDDDADGDADANVNVLQLRPGTNKILTVAAAIVSWNLDVAPSVSSVRALKPHVLDWLFQEISWGDKPSEPTEEEVAGSPLPVSDDSSETPEPELDVEHS
jgi:hypothetical protein